MLCVGGADLRKSTKRVNIHSGTVSDEADMSEGRWWPGIVLFASSVYVFGGSSTTKVLRAVQSSKEAVDAVPKYAI